MSQQGETNAKPEPNLALPGEVLGTTEEYVSGTGTYEEGGQILASQVGSVSINGTTRQISIKPATSTPVVLEVGDYAIGKVHELRNKMTVLTIWYKEGNERPISSDSLGSLYIAKVSPEFLDNVRDAFMIGDIVRARVVQAQPSVQLDTSDADCGVILAHCKVCNIPMVGKKFTVDCPDCSRSYKKKLSTLYRKIQM
jgi:exosome complex component CSL4